jgi:hypothetical protein
LLQAPRLEADALPEWFVVREMRGLTAVLHPSKREATPVLRPGTPVVVTFGWPDFVRRLEGLILEGPWDGDVILVRLPKLPEQRAHRRYDESLQVELQVIKEGREVSPPVEGTALDVSAGGIRLVSEVQIEEGSHCFVTVHLPEGMPAVLIGEAVADSSPSDEAEGLETRFRFTTVSEDDRGRLVRQLTTAAKMEERRSEAVAPPNLSGFGFGQRDAFRSEGTAPAEPAESAEATEPVRQ